MYSMKELPKRQIRQARVKIQEVLFALEESDDEMSLLMKLV